MSDDVINSRNDRHNPIGDLDELRTWARNHMASHVNALGVIGPDFIIGPPDDPQLERWFIIPRNSIQNVYLHRFNRSDFNGAAHDHPWDNRTLVIDNLYVEHLQGGSSITRHAGDVVERTAIEAHWVEIVNGPSLSLFITGPIIRGWGFYCPRGWKPWRERVTIGAHGNDAACGEP